MKLARLNQRALSEPIRLRRDRFEALVAAHEAFLAGRPGGRRATLSFIIAAGFNCDRRTLADARFDGSDFSGTSFVGADLSRTSLYCANLSRCDFREANMQRADLRGATFAGASLAGANLDQADMRAAVLWASDEIRGLRWVGGRSAAAPPDPETPEAGGPVTHGVDFSNCSLQGARLRDANLKNADFTGANLSNAELIGARLEGVRLKGAILTGVDIAKLSIAPSALRECVMDPSREAIARVGHIRHELDRAKDWITTGGSPAHLEGFDLRPAAELFQDRLLAGLQAKGAVAIGLDFSRAKLQGANFDGADLRGANFTGADLRGVSFLGANLAHAIFKEAEIGELELRPGLRLPTRFDNAQVVGAGLPPELTEPPPPPPAA
jgi:uncharacterized protein YjbI with pentapeptide repeats